VFLKCYYNQDKRCNVYRYVVHNYKKMTLKKPFKRTVGMLTNSTITDADLIFIRDFARLFINRT
jgi:hypothetical protein